MRQEVGDDADDRPGHEEHDAQRARAAPGPWSRPGIGHGGHRLPEPLGPIHRGRWSFSFTPTSQVELRQRSFQVRRCPARDHPTRGEDDGVIGDLQRRPGRTARRPGWRRPRRRSGPPPRRATSTTSGASPIDSSSRSSTPGRVTTARARASICCSPPDIVPATWLAPLAQSREAVVGLAPRSRSSAATGVGGHPQVLAHGEVREDAPALGDQAQRRPGPDRSARAPLTRRPASEHVAAGGRVQPGERPAAWSSCRRRWARAAATTEPAGTTRSTPCSTSMAP